LAELHDGPLSQGHVWQDTVHQVCRGLARAPRSARPPAHTAKLARKGHEHRRSATSAARTRKALRAAGPSIRSLCGLMATSTRHPRLLASG